MNPLFPAHLVADFLLQPKSLVLWKQRDIGGVAVHAAVHAVIMSLFIMPGRFRDAAILALIALSHALIDHAKIRYEKKYGSSSKSFLLDQCAHFVILVAASFFLSPPSFWHSEAGRGILSLFLFFSFGLGAFYLSRKPVRTIKILLVSIVFAAFLIPTKLLSAPPCFGP